MANRNAAAAAAPAKDDDDDDDDSTVNPQAIRDELAGGDRVVLPLSPPRTINHVSREEEKDDDTEDDKSDDDSLSPPPAYAARSKKKQAPSKQAASKKKPASKKKQAPEPAQTMCCAGDLCQCGGIIIGSNGHSCVVCKERMHGGICSDGKSDEMNGMTCKKCSKSETGRKGRRQTRRTAPSTTPLSTQTNTRGRGGQQAKAAAVDTGPSRRSRRTIRSKIGWVRTRPLFFSVFSPYNHHYDLNKGSTIPFHQSESIVWSLIFHSRPSLY